MLRYVERNALRAGLVDRAESWPHGSLAACRSKAGPVAIEPGPVPRDDVWLARVNQPMSEAELAALRRCVNRGSPFGSEPWMTQTASVLGLESSLRPRGRPRKDAEK